MGLFQLFVADKISNKGCFTVQARCPEMVFLEERSNWESGPGALAMRAALGNGVCVSPFSMWQEGSVLPCLHTQGTLCPCQGAESCSHSRL